MLLHKVPNRLREVEQHSVKQPKQEKERGSDGLECKGKHQKNGHAPNEAKRVEQNPSGEAANARLLDVVNVLLVHQHFFFCWCRSIESKAVDQQPRSFGRGLKDRDGKEDNVVHLIGAKGNREEDRRSREENRNERS